MALSLVFQNSHFVAVDKPAEVLSVPSRLGGKDPRPVMGLMLQDLLNQKIYPVHRLDEDVSGLLLYALNSDAHRAANRWFESHEIQKTYEAVSPPPPADMRAALSETMVWECKLMRGKRRAYEADYGKPSVTTAKLVGLTPDDRAVWHLQPRTGRSHQLRYEMARHGYPIDRDTLYGSIVREKAGHGIRLRAVQLDFRACSNFKAFNLPEIMTIQSIIPIDFT